MVYCNRGEIYSLVWNETSHLHFSAAEQIDFYYKKKTNMVLQDALSTVDAAKLFYKIIWSENNFNKFYKTVITTEEHNIVLSELPRYLRLQIKNES